MADLTLRITDADLEAGTRFVSTITRDLNIIREVSPTRVIATQETRISPKEWQTDYRILDRLDDGTYASISVEESLPNAIQRAHILKPIFHTLAEFEADHVRS